MEKLIGLVLVLGLVGVWACGMATWILVLTNLLWLLVKGSVLVSWWWPIGTGIYVVSAVVLAFWFKITS